MTDDRIDILMVTSWVKIPISRGKSTVVNLIDFPDLSCWSWSYNNGYAQRGVRRHGHQIKHYMHRQIMGYPIGREVDHINGDRLDNRRSNLRLATSQQNKRNMGIRSDNTSGYKGVSWRKQDSKWWAQIMIDGHTRSLGIYDSPEAAALAYSEGAKKYFGDFGRVK